MGRARAPESVYEELDRAAKSPISGKDFSFDSEALERHMESDDPTSLVLKAHLYVEHILIRHVEMSIGKANDIEIDRMNFPLKVALARRFMMNEICIDACIYLNVLRNKAAHRVDFDIGEREVDALVESMGEHFRNAILEMSEDLSAKGSGKGKKYLYILKACLKTLIIVLEIGRIQRERHEKVLLRRLREFNEERSNQR